VYLVYKPEGSEEPQRWKYNPKKLMSPERERIEQLTGLDFAEFTQRVVKGNSRCRRALLFVYLKRQHPTTRFEDVDFAWDELTLEYSRAELQQIRDQAAEGMTPEQAAIALPKMDEEIAAAFEDPDDVEGKAGLPLVD
jgi:hypothetical protein